jgi:hypothetical protein
MIIGGEHYFSPLIFFRRSRGYIDDLVQYLKSEYYINFTFGGYFSILAIIDVIKSNCTNDSFILLPSYSCPSILIPFKKKGLKYKFYKVDDELLIDTDYLISIIDDKVKAVFFIDYFGTSQLENIQIVLDILRLKQIKIVQDIVQSLQIKKEQLYGDYIFNSFRKFFPFEGSILLSKERINVNFSNDKNKYIKPKRIGQLLRYFHIRFNFFSSKLFLKLFYEAEQSYYVDEILRMPDFNLKQLNKFCIDQIIENHKYYFNLLYKEFGSKMPNLLNVNDTIPFCFIIKLKNRDLIRRELFNYNIFLPIHWILSKEIEQSIFEKSNKLSSIILTIPLSGLTTKKYIYLIENLKKTINYECIS